MSDAYFISDLHLSENNPEATKVFQKFLKILKPKDSLYILGDFFDFWVHHKHESPSKFESEILDQLKQKIQKNNTQAYFMPGNRDFLLHPKVMQDIGIKYLPNTPTNIIINQKNILIAHGDQWCTDDISYQRYNKIVQNKLIQKIFFTLPKSLREYIATKVRQKSTQKQQSSFEKDLKPIDVTPDAILKSIQNNGNNQNNQKTNSKLTHYIIHGHTHRLGIHYHQDTIRLVLGDWHECGSFVKISSHKEPSLYNF